MTFAVWEGRAATGGQGVLGADRRGSWIAWSRWIRQHTLARFGPWPGRAQHVFELHFEGIAESPRHKRRRVRFRHRPVANGQEASDADTLQSLRA